ncbi:hypothetical protein [Nocardioides piscis]|uniref:DUF4352 domain-containing protein n=1 Tax=Nocardioides piscis TaxID=2714938 RepID=A0A6G7YGJ9_9ACTN|nr:hypothetical protein [Nocardioides piscis]QIK76024.1 hypothetical protein G7071_11845 [Nocardioides piscis]
MIRGVLPALALVLALSACAADDPEPAAEATTPTASAPSAPIVLSFGEAESVVWRPTDDLDAELEIQVDRVREGDPADFRGLVGPGFSEANQPYYVDVALANQGSDDLGGLDVPLYLRDSSGVLAPPWGFSKPFEPCPSGPLPDSFEGGDDVKKCLVFLASPDATFGSITYWPQADAQPVRWIGEVRTLEEPAKSRKPARKRGARNR